jgi:hypothetical protein
MKITSSKVSFARISVSKASGLVFTLALALTLAACGGSPSSQTQPPPAVAVALNHSTASVAIDATMQFSASVQNTTNTSVTWAVDSVSGGNSTVGTVSSTGLYTAPSAAGTHSVTATSVADTTKSASAAVTVTPTVSVAPGTASVPEGATQQFMASVQGESNTSVTWSVDQIGGGNSTVGTINSAGLYTAPMQTGNHTVTATLAASTSTTASASVTVTPVAVSVAPGSALVVAGATQQFTATVQGLSNNSVTWSVDGVAGGNTTIGTISASGLYTSPTQPGSHTITATSVANTADSGAATVSVGTASITPASALLNGGATEQFNANIQGFTNTAVTWSVDGVSGGNATVGTISSTGAYTAPASVGSHTITAISAADTSLTASAAVSILVLTISPTAVTVAPSATEQFNATIQGTTNTQLTWSVDGIAGGNATVGTITANGLYSAPFATGGHTVTVTSAVSSSITISTSLTVINTATGAVLTYHNDDARDGAFTQETTLNTANVNSIQFGKLFSYPVDGQIYAQPLYLPNVTIGGVSHSVVYVATQNNSLYAFDATGTQTTPFWQVNLGPPVTKDDTSGVNPYVGILSTPVIDATTNTIYVFAEVSGTSFPFYLYALDVATGAQKLAGSVQVNGSVTGTEGGSSSHTIGLDSACYQRMGLALDPVTNAIYIPFGSCPHGWVLAYDKTTLKQKAIFNDTPDDNGGGGLWSSGGAAAIDDTTGELYLMTGVDAGDEITTGFNDSFLRLDPKSLAVLDYFTPDNALILEQNDADLGSGSNILMPPSAAFPHETIGGGKDGNIFVVNRDKMGSFDSTNNVIQTLQTGTQQYNNIFSTPVYWNGFVYFHCSHDGLRSFNWSSTTGMLTFNAVAAPVYTTHGATASVSANGNTNGIVWDIDNTAYSGTNPSASGPLVLHAYDATNVATELYNSSQAGSRDTAGLALKFTVPTIAGGRVFIPTATELDVYGLLP